MTVTVEAKMQTLTSELQEGRSAFKKSYDNVKNPEQVLTIFRDSAYIPSR
jgi:hypothetical protein